MRRSEDMPVPLGAVLEGKYRIDRVIGHGGMGIVYGGTHLALARGVAVKVMRPSLSADPDSVARFDREARATCGLTNKHVAKMFDVGRTDDGDPYLVMELLTGNTLQARITKAGTLEPDRVVAVALDIVAALEEAHAAGIIHRDLKPANVFLGATGAKVLDFGIAKVEAARGDAPITTTGTMIGTPEYMAPEQLDTKRGVTTKSDVWALGVTMYNALTGKTPFEAESFYELSIKVYAHEPTPITKHRSDLSPELVALIGGCLQKDSKKRLTLEEVAERLEALPRAEGSEPFVADVVDEPVSSATMDATPVEVMALTLTDVAPTLVMPAKAIEPPPARTRPMPSWLIAAAGALALVLSILFLILRRREPPPEPPAAPTTEVEPAAEEDPRVMAATPLPVTSSSKSTPHLSPRRRPAPAPKGSNGALTHER